MIRLRYIKALMLIVFLAVTTAGCGGCFGGLNTMGLHIFSTKIEVRGANGTALIGAIVRCSNGETVSVDSTGFATIHFSDIGSYYVSVTYQNNIIASYNLSIPSDAGKTYTANYTPPAAPAPATTTTNSSTPMNSGMAGGNYFAAMGAQLYPMLFQYVFNAYGYSIDLAAYQPGQYTEWQISTNGEKQISTRKAFLKKLDNGQEWWQVSFQEESDSMTLEVLFSDKHESIRRMRQRFGSQAPSEVPVTEGWYTSPMQLTPESLEGSVTKKGVSITVPAGTFTCDLLEFGVAPQTTLRMWRTTSVPGGVVKYELDSGGNEAYTGELKAYGNGATTALGSY
jgi:hypothetical protein